MKILVMFKKKEMSDTKHFVSEARRWFLHNNFGATQHFSIHLRKQMIHGRRCYTNKSRLE